MTTKEVADCAGCTKALVDLHQRFCGECVERGTSQRINEASYRAHQAEQINLAEICQKVADVARMAGREQEQRLMESIISKVRYGSH